MTEVLKTRQFAPCSVPPVGNKTVCVARTRAFAAVKYPAGRKLERVQILGTFELARHDMSESCFVGHNVKIIGPNHNGDASSVRQVPDIWKFTDLRRNPFLDHHTR